MLSQFLMLLAGLALLVAGADLMVRGAARLAVSLGIAPLVVGLTVVAFGTSAPELAVSVDASLGGNPALAIGNVVGSNIANVLLILGISALITPLVVHEQIVRQEIPIMIGTSLLVVVMALDHRIGLFESLLLFVLVLAYTAFLIVQSRRAGPEAADEFADEIPRSQWDARRPVQLALIVVGLGMLVLGANWLVEAAVGFARELGVSDLVIGLTIVAVGTSMPEVATSIVAALRGQRDIAVGNVVGSNVFNLLAVLGLTGLVSADGLPVADAARNFDLWVMLAVAFACLPVFLTGRQISRWEGALFLGYYLCYLAYLVLAAQQHAALPGFSATMLGYVLPLTVVTLVVSLLRPRHACPPPPP